MRDFGDKRSTTWGPACPAPADPTPGKRTLTETLPSARTTHDDPVPPGKPSRSSLLTRAEHPAPSGIVQGGVKAGEVEPPAPAMPSGLRPTINELFGGRSGSPSMNHRFPHSALRAGYRFGGPATTALIQQRASGDVTGGEPAAVHEAAHRGIATSATHLPHLEQIQRPFGKHDVSGVKAHVGGDAAASARAMGAQAYATGNHVVLSDGADLHTIAHEAAHVVQQRGGVQLKGGVDWAGWLDVAIRPDVYDAPVQREADSAGAAGVHSSVSGGKALPEDVQTRMEGAFGTDFSAVRIHEGREAAALGALAYTQGSDISFAPGQYQPESQRGQELLGHELAHVVQQAEGRVQATTQAKGVAINDDAALEREADEAGARAARGESVADPALEGAAGRTIQPKAAPIQRAVGFELEINDVKTYRKGNEGERENLKKKDPILITRDYRVEADEMPSHSNMEFVTEEFPETPEGGKRLKKALKSISTIIDRLTNRDGEEIPAQSLGGNEGLFLGPTSQVLIGKPQATAGVHLGALDRLFSRVSHQPLIPPPVGGARTVFGGQLMQRTGQPEARGASGMLDVAQARGATRAMLISVGWELVNADAPVPYLYESPELTSLVTMLVMYLAQGAKGVPGYGKTIAGPFLMRTDFATVFQQLPESLLNFFREKTNRQIFLDIVLGAALQAAQQIGYQGDMASDGLVFEGGLYNDTAMFGTKSERETPFGQLTRNDWLYSLIEGEDLLTSANFPGDAEERAEIESLGEYGGQMDLVANHAGKEVSGPLVEFRGFKPIYAGLFLPLALDLFRYVHTLNTGGREGFPGGRDSFLDLEEDDSMALATGDSAGAIRKRLLTAAMGHIQKWQ